MRARACVRCVVCLHVYVHVHDVRVAHARLLGGRCPGRRCRVSLRCLSALSGGCAYIN